MPLSSSPKPHSIPPSNSVDNVTAAACLAMIASLSACAGEWSQKNITQVSDTSVPAVAPEHPESTTEEQ